MTSNQSTMYRRFLKNREAAERAAGLYVIAVIEDGGQWNGQEKLNLGDKEPAALVALCRASAARKAAALAKIREVA